MSIAPRILPSSMWSRGSKSNSTGVPTVSISLKSSSPPAGASSAARLGIDISARLPLLLGGGLGGLGRLDLGGQRLGLGEQRLLLLALRLRDQLAELLLLAALGLEARRSPCRRAVSAASARSTTSSDSPRLAWAARTRSGSSRRMRGSIMRQGYPGSRRRECAREITCGWATAYFPGPRARPTPRHRPELGRALLRALRRCSTVAVVDDWRVAGRPRQPRRVRRRTWATDVAWLHDVLRGRRDRLRHDRDDGVHGRARRGAAASASTGARRSSPPA